VLRHRPVFLCMLSCHELKIMPKKATCWFVCLTDAEKGIRRACQNGVIPFHQYCSLGSPRKFLSTVLIQKFLAVRSEGYLTEATLVDFVSVRP